MSRTPASSPGPVNPAPAWSSRSAGQDGETPLKAWKRKRQRTSDLSASEIVNMMEGLTPDGYDKNGVKASFVEKDKPFGGPSRRRLSED